tara:strand:- start:9 stop:314 length:306 start_codon:yes stop_codon:yes gene_type:complete
MNEFEKKIRNKLLMRGFPNEKLINNRGLIGATIDEVILEVVKNIGVTRCCETLKDEEEMTFTKWLNKWNWEQIGNSYVFKRGESYTDAESLMKSYKKEYNL